MEFTVTAVSVKVTVPVEASAGVVPIWVKLTPSVERSTTKLLSVVALSFQLKLTLGPVCREAVRVVGAAGGVTNGTNREALFE